MTVAISAANGSTHLLEAEPFVISATYRRVYAMK